MPNHKGTLLIGLTGSIGMGKSTTLGFFKDAGIPVHSADEAVHALYSGRAAPLIEAEFAGTVEGGIVNREKLSAAVLGNPVALKRLETIVHPLVREEELAFVDRARRDGSRLAVIDIPLLFETDGEGRFDKIIVVSADKETQRRRVLARPGMTEAKLDAILARQMPDIEKRKRADFIIETGEGLDAARQAVQDIVKTLTPNSLDLEKSADNA